uniref:mS110 n=1 Tax=Polytomella magna TaxID=353565 RepID=UPI002240E3CA|nr:Chain Yd, mS110 [Polytomella magna]8APN_Yd Chain Yd, mS110 [Polytomella magna]8APO_Yd Chain Yd, mS110 [Polytomella magna]
TTRRRKLLGSRYGARLAKKNRQQFERARVILDCYSDEELRPDSPPVAVKEVTINTLQTMRFLFPQTSKEHLDIKQNIASYKIFSLNRELLSLLPK